MFYCSEVSTRLLLPMIFDNLHMCAHVIFKLVKYLEQVCIYLEIVFFFCFFFSNFVVSQ